MHDKRRADQSEEEFRDSVLNESRVAGAINVIVLKLIGYSGLMKFSAFESGYRRI